MRYTVLVTFISLLALLSYSASATVPPNDNCDGVSLIDDCTVDSYEGNTAEALNDFDPGIGGCTGRAEEGRDVAYYIELGQGDQVHMVYTQLYADGAIYAAFSCEDVAGTCLIGADAHGVGQAETLDFTAPGFGPLYIILDSFGAESGGPFVLEFSITCTPEACCDLGGNCTMLPPGQCWLEGGVPMGPGTDCDTVQCPPDATEAMTWGQIRSLYR